MPKLLILILLLGLAACQTTDPYSRETKFNKATKGAVIGALSGAVIGAVTGDSKRALKGAALGAATGGGVGYYMDRQEDKLRTQLRASGVSVTRQGEVIVLNMPGNVTFDTNSSNISADFYSVLDSVGLVINEFDQTYVEILGFTDSTGSASYNQRLSARRADSVYRYLTRLSINPQRLTTRGLGLANPIASNATAQGRAQNRRVEIYLNPIR